MSLLGQLKQRGVFRIGMFYIVAAWVLVQVTDIILQNFASPDWVMKLLVFFCFAGFPFALWLSWTFEMTPDGLRKEEHVDRTREPHPEQGRKLDYIIMALLAVVVGLAAGSRWVQASLSHRVGTTVHRVLLHRTLRASAGQTSPRAGTTLGRVLEAESLDAVAVEGGLLAGLAVLDLLVAAWVLSQGAAAPAQLLSLGIWTGLALFGAGRQTRARRTPGA